VIITSSTEYENFFNAGMEVRFGLHLAGDNMFSDYAEIISIENDRIHLKLYKDLPHGLRIEAGREAIISTIGSWAHCRCHMVLEKRDAARDLFFRFQGPVTEQQQREYFRFDVFIPLRYKIPTNGDRASTEEKWYTSRLLTGNKALPVTVPWEKGQKIVRWNGTEEILPMWVNLSGGGLRIMIKERLETDTILDLEIFLPMNPTRVINAVGEVLRVKEQELSWERDTLYSTAMKFHLIDAKEREAIIAYIFMEQRNSLQKRIRQE